MELLLGSLLPLLPATFAAVGDEPSFLFILGDDIGWQDFSYNNGTAASPFINVSIYHLFLFFFFFFQKVLSADTDGTNPRTYAHKRDTNTQWLQGSLLSDTDAQTLADIACIRSTHAKPLILGLVLFPILFPASCFLLPASCFCVRVHRTRNLTYNNAYQQQHVAHANTPRPPQGRCSQRQPQTSRQKLPPRLPPKQAAVVLKNQHAGRHPVLLLAGLA